MLANLSLYKDILDNLHDAVYFVDRDRVIRYWNKGAERITGYSSQQVIGRSCRDNVLNHVNAQGIQLCRDLCPLAACMNDGNPREADVFLHHADGHRVPVLVRGVPMKDAQGNTIGAVETFSRDTGWASVRQELGELRHTVRTDKLTGIGNRLYLEGRLCGALAELQYQKGTAGLLFMDIDRFKAVNDDHGHDLGDRVLRMVAATLQHNVRAFDSVGRWGGEEFVAILGDITTLTALESIGNKLRALVESSRLDLATTSLTVTISVGGTLFRPDDTQESIVRRADELMYQSKRAGRNRVSVG